jgi:hypothetical protein
MTYHMTVQLPITDRWGTDEELALRHRLEEEFQNELGELGSVDGGDIGSGKMSVFIYGITDFTPALDRVKTVLTRHRALDRAVIQRSTYRNEDDDEPEEQAVVWPENFKGTFRLF